MKPLWQLGVVELLAAYRGDETTPDAVLTQLLGRIKKLDPKVNAFTALDRQRVLADALTSTKRYANGTARFLEGVPIAVKELIGVEGLPHTGQSQTRADVIAAHDAPVVAELRNLGAIVVGTTRTHELAWGITTQHETLGGANNPWNRDLVPGGSSGGSAAAVAAGFVPVALGTDTACSVRLPATCCGVVGFKPTHATLSAEDVIPLAPSYDTVGLLARHAEDITKVMSALGALPSTKQVVRRVGVARLDPDAPLGADQLAAYESAVEAIRDTGVDVVDVHWPHGDAVAETFRVVQSTEALDTHTQVLKSWPDKRDLYGSDVRSLLESAETVTDEDRRTAAEHLGELRQQWDLALESVDVVLLPSMPTPPSSTTDPDTGSLDGQPVPFRIPIGWQSSANLNGIPSCAVPSGTKYFQGVQLCTRRGNDAMVLAFAETLQPLLDRREARWPDFSEETT